MATHGKNGRVEIEDPATPGTYVDVSSYAYNADMAFSRDLADSSVFGLGDKTSVAGLRDGTFSVDIRYGTVVFALLFAIYSTDSPVNVRYYPNGTGTGKQRLQAQFLLNSMTPVRASLSDTVGGSVSFQRTGATTVTTI